MDDGRHRPGHLLHQLGPVCDQGRMEAEVGVQVAVRHVVGEGADGVEDVGLGSHDGLATGGQGGEVRRQPGCWRHGPDVGNDFVQIGRRGRGHGGTLGRVACSDGLGRF